MQMAMRKKAVSLLFVISKCTWMNRREVPIIWMAIYKISKKTMWLLSRLGGASAVWCLPTGISHISSMDFLGTQSIYAPSITASNR